MIRTQVYFEEKDKRELMALMAKKKAKFSQVLRDVVRAGLEQEGVVTKKRMSRSELLKKFVGVDKSHGNRFLSRDIDKTLYEDPYE